MPLSLTIVVAMSCQSPNKNALVNDFFSTIEEAGISDIAAEVGIIPQKDQPAKTEPEEPANGGSSSSMDMTGCAAPVSFHYSP